MAGDAFTNYSGNKSLHRFLHFLSIVGCIILAFFIGTQYIAGNTGHEDTYQPFMGLVWALEAWVNGEDISVYLSGLKISLVVAGVGILLVKFLFWIFGHGFNKAETPSDWDNTKGLLKGNLLNQDGGLYLGLWEGNYIKENSGEHVMVVAPTGSGKSTGYVVPNLLAHPGSAIVVDIKGEIHRLTSGYRKNVLKQKVIAVDFTCSDILLEKDEIEGLGLNWKSFTGRVVELKWGELIDENTLKLTEDPARISRQAENVFGEEAAKILAIFQKPHRSSCSGINPLDEIHMGMQEVRDIQNLAETLIDPQAKGNPDHWHRLAKTIFSALVLHTLYARKEKTLSGVANLASDPDRQMYEVLNSMLQTQHDPEGFHNWFDKSKSRFTKTHPIIASLAREMKDKQFEELSGIMSTMMGFLTLFRDPIIDRNTNHSDFRISDIFEGEQPVTLYFIIPPSDIHRIMPLVRLVFNQILIRMMDNKNLLKPETVSDKIKNFFDVLLGMIPGMNKKGEEQKVIEEIKKHKVLFVLDEFPALGQMDILKNALPYMRGYNIRALLICQDLDQINEIYGKNNSLLGQFKIRIYHATNSDTTARQISADAGETVENDHSVSYSNGKETHSYRKVIRPLVSYSEAKQIPDTDAIIFREGQKPIYATKIVYWKDRWFSKMAKIPPVLISDASPHESEFAALTDVAEHKKLYMDDPRIKAVLKANVEKRVISEPKPVEVASHSVDFKKNDSI